MGDAGILPEVRGKLWGSLGGRAQAHKLLWLMRGNLRVWGLLGQGTPLLLRKMCELEV